MVPRSVAPMLMASTAVELCRYEYRFMLDHTTRKYLKRQLSKARRQNVRLFVEEGLDDIITWENDVDEITRISIEFGAITWPSEPLYTRLDYYIDTSYDPDEDIGDAWNDPALLDWDHIWASQNKES